MKNFFVATFAIVSLAGACGGAPAVGHAEPARPPEGFSLEEMEATPYPLVKKAAEEYRHGQASFFRVMESGEQCIVTDLESAPGKISGERKERLLERLKANYHFQLELAQSTAIPELIASVEARMRETLARLAGRI